MLVGFGHDAGDQVLRMVASHLARVGGGGTSYRCGGEEVPVLFPRVPRQQAGGLGEELPRPLRPVAFAGGGAAPA